MPADGRFRTAMLIAVVADIVQWIALPLFAAGVIAPWNDVIDVAVGVMLVRLIGWHWSFLPTFLVELFPIVDLVPTWTLAVLLASRRQAARKEPA